MKWFSGSINEAVAASKSRKAVFVVFVAGKDDASSETTKVIDSPEISTRLEQDDFVAIRLESDTESYRFFAQIYQLVPVPSLFFIGDNGSPLEVIAGSVTVPSLLEKIDSILVKVGKGKNEASSNFIRAEQSAVGAASASAAGAVQQPVVQEKQPEAVEASSKNEEHVKPEQTDATNPPELSPEEKVERARKLIELQKQQRVEKEREEERLREIERRKLGREVQTARQRQQDLEIKMAQEERMKEKAAETEARERVRQQIAQDKLERKQREQALLQQASQQQSAERPQQAAVAPADGIVRIQFRLPSGTSHLGKFETTSTLRDLRIYVSGNIDLPFRNFSMSTSFPRMELNAEDDDRTLLDLQLVPTAVILILPLKSTTTPTTVAPREDGSFLSRFMWTVFSPIISVYNYVIGYFTGGQARDSNRDESNEASASMSGTSAPPSRNIGQPSGLFARNFGGPSTTIRSRGNIHRLHSGGDDNDENNTWNGNSTQQM